MERKPKGLIANARRLRREATEAESLLWSDLRSNRLNGFRFTRQHPLPPYVVDFACRSEKLVIELDGSQHAECERDRVRTAFLNGLGWSVLRFWNDEVSSDRDGVCETILAALHGRITEGCDGAGLLHGLRFFPRSPSPGSLREPPSPAGGRGAGALHFDGEACP